MAQVWASYFSDLGRAYPMVSIQIIQVNEVPTNINPLDLLPPTILAQILRVSMPCGVNGLTLRKLSLWLGDGAQFLISYPQPFSENLADYLNLQPDIQAWEFVGERIKYGRLRKMLDNV
jgi:hypothetical protein